MPTVNKTTAVLFICDLPFSFLEVKSSLRFRRRAGARDDLEIRACGVGDDLRLPFRQRCDVDQVRTYTQRRSACFQKAGCGLQRDTAGRHQPQITETEP